MSVVIETTLGDITVDLYLKERPRACLNFLKLCKIKYYNYSLFHTISRNFIAQTGDPTGSRSGGESIFGVLQGPLKRYFEAETVPRIKHTMAGLISFVGNEEGMIGSQFFITLAPDLQYLDAQHCVFGEVVEGHDILDLLNEVICDGDNRPYQDVRITHTVILDDPLPDPKALKVPERSPSPSAERLQGGRIAPDEEIDETAGKSLDEINEMIAEREAKARATILEMVGDIPDVDVAPPENVLFVCKLNPVTTDDDLEIIFSRFGKIKSCEVIRDRKTGDSLQYAFVEFEEQKACEDAYFKMDNVLIDDRRIHVDFSQSVAKVKWHGKGRGVTHYDDRGKKTEKGDRNIGKGNYKAQQNREKRSDDKRERNIDRGERNERRERDNYANGQHDFRYSREDRRYVEERERNRRRGRSRSRETRNRRDIEDRHQRSRDSWSRRRMESSRKSRSRSRDRNDDQRGRRQEARYERRRSNSPERTENTSRRAGRRENKRKEASSSERDDSSKRSRKRKGSVEPTKSKGKKNSFEDSEDASNAGMKGKNGRRKKVSESSDSSDSEANKKKRRLKKKQKKESSSESESEESSSDSSSSSEDKKKKANKKKRKERQKKKRGSSN